MPRGQRRCSAGVTTTGLLLGRLALQAGPSFQAGLSPSAGLPMGLQSIALQPGLQPETSGEEVRNGRKTTM